ncbi:MAG: ASKHA domain-containing protein [Arenicellales bacterium]|nr:ASKHA domain-containing protein [Arenicellales bacterium]
MVTTDCKAVFLPSGKRGSFARGTTLLQAARSLGVDIDSVCGGRAMCGRCQILCSEGDFPKQGIVSRKEHLSAFGAVEQRYSSEHGSLGERRLACQARIQGDVVVDVPPESQVHRQVIRKGAKVIEIELDPVVRLYYVEVQEPNMHDPTGDLSRLKMALEFEWGLTDLQGDLGLLQGIQAALAEGDWKVTVAVHNDERIICVWPGFRDRALGAAVDVGSTTVAIHLCDLATGEVVASSGKMNPQIRYGEDLMSRVSYVMMHPRGDVEMTRVVREAINELLVEVTTEVDATTDDILDLTFVANPVMHHLLLGIDPTQLGGAPFALATDEAVAIWANEIDLRVNRNARTYVLPCIAGHVGADAAGVILSERPYQDDAMTLLVDVGTNAEIILGNRNRLLACSSPTGPAFEGAQISSGQRAAPGAIERVRIDPTTLEPRFSIIGSELWSDEEGFEESIKATGVTGICGSGIIEVIATMYLAGIVRSDGTIDGALCKRSDRVVSDGRTFSYVLYDGDVKIHITQNDVRQVQLAKAALYAGVKLLMDHMQVRYVDRIGLAGAFGNHIDPKYAMVLGLIPDCPLDQVSSVGNAAGNGARIALLDRDARVEIEEVVRRVQKVETAVEPRFQEHFVEAMAIPHQSDEYPNLAKEVDLPPPMEPASSSVTQSSRRRRARR